jgi:integrase
MYIRFKKFLKTHDLPDVSIHDLRRSFAKLSIEGDARLEQVSEALGHASIETTKSIYIGSVPKLAKRAFSAFDDYINPNHHHPLQEIQGNS